MNKRFLCVLALVCWLTMVGSVMAVQPDITRALLAGDWEQMTALIHQRTEDVTDPVTRMILSYAMTLYNRNNEARILSDSVYDEDERMRFIDWADSVYAANPENAVAAFVAADANRRGFRLKAQRDQRDNTEMMWETVAIYHKTVQLQPEFALAFERRGRAFFALRQNDSALFDFDKAIELEPMLYKAYLGRGAVKERLKLPREAIQAYDLAIKVDSTAAEGFAFRAGVHRVLKNFDQALADLDMAITLDATYDLPYLLRGVTYEQMGRFEEAIEAGREFLKRAHPKNGKLLKGVEQRIEEMEKRLTGPRENPRGKPREVTP